MYMVLSFIYLYICFTHWCIVLEQNSLVKGESQTSHLSKLCGNWHGHGLLPGTKQKLTAKRCVRSVYGTCSQGCVFLKGQPRTQIPTLMPTWTHEFFIPAHPLNQISIVKTPLAVKKCNGIAHVGFRVVSGLIAKIVHERLSRHVQSSIDVGTHTLSNLVCSKLDI